MPFFYEEIYLFYSFIKKIVRVLKIILLLTTNCPIFSSLDLFFFIIGPAARGQPHAGRYVKADEFWDCFSIEFRCLTSTVCGKFKHSILYINSNFRTMYRAC